MRRLYAMLLIGVLMLGSIPELRTVLQDKLIVAQPIVQQTAKLAFDNVSAIVVPLAGRIIGKPVITLTANGKPVKIDTDNDFLLTHGQSLSPEQIDKILDAAGSPAKGTGADWVKYGIESDIDAAYGLAIFSQESSLGTASGWYPAGYNTGNIICAGYWKCHGRFRDYSGDAQPWQSSIKDVMALLRDYRDGGIKTYDEAIFKWAPPEDNNNTDGYVKVTKELISQWRSTNKNIINENGSVITALQSNGIKVPFGDAQALSTPISQDTSNGFGLNVRSALDASNGALRNIVIKNGERWSFNQTVANPDVLKLATVSGVYGGGWCDLACRYIQVFKGLGLGVTNGTNMDSNDIVYLLHSVALNGCSYEESPLIWSAGNIGFDDGMQDLIVNNRTGKTIYITVIDNDDGTATVAGKLQ